jgi:hypothetical protein
MVIASPRYFDLLHLTILSEGKCYGRSSLFVVSLHFLVLSVQKQNKRRKERQEEIKEIK